jgi:hypothetical protein
MTKKNAAWFIHLMTLSASQSIELRIERLVNNGLERIWKKTAYHRISVEWLGKGTKYLSQDTNLRVHI